MAGDINHLSDKIQSRRFFGFHGFRGEFFGIHTADGDFGFCVAFRALRFDLPVIQEPRDVFQFFGRMLIDRFVFKKMFADDLAQTGGEKVLEKIS